MIAFLNTNDITSTPHKVHRSDSSDCSLCSWLFLLSEPQRFKRHSGHLHHFEPDSGDITDGMARPTEPGHEHLVILIDEIQTTVIWNKGCDLFTVFDQLHPNTLSDGRVGLLSLNSQSLCDNALCMGTSRKRIGLERCERVFVAIRFFGPFVSSTNILQRTSGSDTFWFTTTHFDCKVSADAMQRRLTLKM